MNNPSQPGTGRPAVWFGVVAAFLGIALVGVQYFALHLMFMPWYQPLLGTLGAIALLYSFTQRRTITRFVLLALITLLAAGEWYFLLEISKLPQYAGPAKSGEKMPAFQTTLSDGSTFTDKNLQGGQTSAIVFFRGRW